MTRKPRVDVGRLRAALDAGRETAAEGGRTTVRAVASIKEDLHLVARTGRFTFESDQPKVQGGTDLAPSPLQYFLAGAAF